MEIMEREAGTLTAKECLSKTALLSKEDILALEDSWCDLHNSNSVHGPHEEHAWIKVWLLSRDTAGLFGVGVWKEGTFVGFGMFQRAEYKRFGLRLPTIRFASSGLFPWNRIITSKQHETDVIRSILNELSELKPKPSLLEFESLPMDLPGGAVSLSAILEEMGRGTLQRINKTSPYIPFKDYADYSQYASKLGSEFKRQLRKSENRLRKKGESKFTSVVENDLNEETLNTLFNVSARSWKADIGTDIHSVPETSRFYKLYTPAQKKESEALVWSLSIDGQCVAFEYLLRFQKKLFAIRSDYDSSHKREQPGNVLMARGLESCFESDIDEYNFTGQDYSYKYRWTKETREYIRIVCAFDGWLSGALLLARKTLDSLSQRSK